MIVCMEKIEILYSSRELTCVMRTELYQSPITQIFVAIDIHFPGRRIIMAIRIPETCHYVNCEMPEIANRDIESATRKCTKSEASHVLAYSRGSFWQGVRERERKVKRERESERERERERERVVHHDLIKSQIFNRDKN